MSSILFTLAEDVADTSPSHFAVKYSVDENDCFDFAAGLQELGHQVFFVNWRDLVDDRFERIFSYAARQFVAPMTLSQFDLAFVYKMEGFLFDLPTFLAMVAQFENHCGMVVNHPRTIRHNIDKHYLLELEAQGVRIIPTFVSDQQWRERLADGKRLVMKPRFGERGNGIFRADCSADLEKISGQENEYLAQAFMPEIRQGERSLVFLGHDFQHAVLKKPSKADPNEFRCNESLGGTVEVYEPTKDELAFSRDLLAVYEKQLRCPVHFSRIDLISVDGAPMLVEAELLNPSIYANYSQKGPQFGRAIAQYFDALLRVTAAT